MIRAVHKATAKSKRQSHSDPPEDTRSTNGANSGNCTSHKTKNTVAMRLIHSGKVR